MADAIIGQIQRLFVTSIQQQPEIIVRAFHQAFQQWTKNEAFCALVAGMSGKNTWAIQKLVVLHQIAMDVLKDDSAAFWIEHHLVDILARMEHPQRLGFDVLAGLLSGYLLVDEDVQEAVESAVESLRVVHPSFGLLSALINRHESQARVALYVGIAAGKKNRLASAISWLQRSLNLACSNELKHRAAKLLGNIYFRTSVYDPLKAVEYYNLAKDAAFQAGAMDAMADSAKHLGLALCESDKFEEAQIMAKQLVEMADGSEDVFVKACAEKLHGLVAFMIGEMPSACAHNWRVISFLKGLPTNEKETEKDFFLGIQNQDSPTRILTTTTMLLDAWDQISLVETDPVAAARAFSEHHKLLLTTGDHKENIFAKVRFLKSACEFHYNRKRLKQAEMYAAELLMQADKVPLPYSKARALLFMVEIAVEYHNMDQSNGYCFEMIKSLLDEAEVLGKPHPRMTLKVLRHQGLNFMRAERPEEAIQKFGEASRKQVQLDDKFGAFNLGRIAYLENNKSSFRLLEECLVEQKRTMDAILWAERERSRDLLYNLRTSVHKDAYLKALADFDRDDVAAHEELKEIARLAGEDTVILMLAFSISNPSAVSCYVLNWNNGEFCHGSYTSQTSQVRDISSFVQITVDDMKSGNGRQSRLLNMWYLMLVKHWETILSHRRFKKLVIIPQEELCMLPFAALREAEGEPFLIQKYAISIAPSLRMYKQCLLRQQALSNSQKLLQPVGLIIGNPTLGADSEYHSLNYAEEEAHNVRETLQEWGFHVTHLEREEATKEAALELLPSSNWVHIASHAVIDKKFPCGALLLGSTDENVSKSRREGLKSNGELEDRLRSLFETSSSTGMLRGEDLESFATDCPMEAMVVVLSACSTGLGLVYSEGILGFTRSFHMLGVPTVLASLWNVDDKSTGVLMQRLYQQLGAGLDISVALQMAIVSMIEEEDMFGCKEYEDPYHWASFVVYGSDKASLVQGLCSPKNERSPRAQGCTPLLLNNSSQSANDKSGS